MCVWTFLLVVVQCINPDSCHIQILEFNSYNFTLVYVWVLRAPSEAIWATGASEEVSAVKSVVHLAQVTTRTDSLGKDRKNTSMREK